MASSTGEGARAKPSAPAGGKGARLAAAVLLVALLPLLAYVVWSSGQRPDGSDGAPRDPFARDTTSEPELRRVHEALSRLIAAAPAQLEAALEGLEAVRAESPGARDLKDSCVNTYRGLLRAQRAEREARALLMLPDGGERPPVAITGPERVRAAEQMREAVEQTELVSQSHQRCHDLYGRASEQLHLAPASRLLRP